ncbi:MAG: c-type cytochrome [Nitrospira sp.]|nr:c-type cytochrome [Nitrospira sp.]
MRVTVWGLFMATMVMVGSAVAAERHMMQPLVPADKLAEARALKGPLPDSPEIVAKGKVIYEGKGACFNCHGTDGSGNGPAAAQLNPSPRNLRHHGFWRHRTEGEIFWVIKHGSPGTAMAGFGPVLSDEEIWSVIRYARTFAGGHGQRGMGHRKGMGSMMGQEGKMGGTDHRGRRGEIEESE